MASFPAGPAADSTAIRVTAEAPTACGDVLVDHPPEFTKAGGDGVPGKVEIVIATAVDVRDQHVHVGGTAAAKQKHKEEKQGEGQ